MTVKELLQVLPAARPITLIYKKTCGEHTYKDTIYDGFTTELSTRAVFRHREVVQVIPTGSGKIEVEIKERTRDEVLGDIIAELRVMLDDEQKVLKGSDYSDPGAMPDICTSGGIIKGLTAAINTIMQFSEGRHREKVE